MSADDVDQTFELLLEEVESLVEDMREVAAELVHAGDLEGGRRAIDDTKAVQGFIDQIRELQAVWRGEMVPRAARYLSNERLEGKRQKMRQLATEPTRGEQLPPGVLTPLEQYRRPLLEVLVELGGSGRSRDVIRRVGAKMAAVLNEYDRQPVRPGSRQTRWELRTAWARQQAVKDGLLKRGSPRGVWEITEAGRQWLSDGPGELETSPAGREPVREAEANAASLEAEGAERSASDGGGWSAGTSAEHAEVRATDAGAAAARDLALVERRHGAASAGPNETERRGTETPRPNEPPHAAESA